MIIPKHQISNVSLTIFLLIQTNTVMRSVLMVTKFGKTTLVAHNNFEQTLTFKHSLFGNFAQEANEIGYHIAGYFRGV